MELPLQTPEPPVTMISGFEAEENSAFTVQCHDKSFKSITASDAAGHILFQAEGEPGDFMEPPAQSLRWLWQASVRLPPQQCRYQERLGRGDP